ncbi:MAG TPA: NDP-sugar synthase [Acidimicrobiales bacterium]|nr:NDP-sugar synthase [Acidimicrobiales bacterium]
MRAVILVGGFGTRLRPLTAHTPKQMLPIVDRPMIERVVAALAGHGVTDAVLSLGYRPDAFLEAYPDDSCAGVALHYAVEPEPLDTAGAVRFAALDGGIEHTFLVFNGDVLSDLDVGELWAFHQRSGAEGTIGLTPVDDPSRYGVVPIDANGRVEAFVEKPPADEAPTNWINAGAYVLEPSVLDRIPAGRRVSIERATFPEMVADGSLYALHSDAYWIDAGTPATYLQAQLDLVDGHRGDPEPGIAGSAVVEGGASVEHSVVMTGAVVEAGAVVRDAVVLPDARIARDSLVDGSIVGARATVGAGAVLRELAVVGDDVQVDAGAVLAGVRVPDQDDG